MPPETFIIGEAGSIARLRAEFQASIADVLARLERNTEMANALSFALDDLAAEVQELKGWSDPKFYGGSE